MCTDLVKQAFISPDGRLAPVDDVREGQHPRVAQDDRYTGCLQRLQESANHNTYAVPTTLFMDIRQRENPITVLYSGVIQANSGTAVHRCAHT